jgi:dihydrofolate reductase
MKASASHDISVGGAALGAVAITADLVDEWHLIVVPHVVGGGTAALPDSVRLQLDLRDAHSFANGTVHLHYRTVR